MTTHSRTNMQRILAGSIDPLLRVELKDQDGAAVDAVGTLTCSIARADGTVIATDRATSDATGPGAYTCALSTAEALTLDVLTATWRISGVTRAISYHRTVGGFMFTVAELAQRARMNEYDALTLRTERDRITDLIEGYCGAQNPRYDIDAWYADRTAWSRVVNRTPLRSVRSVISDGTTLATADYDVDTLSASIRTTAPLLEACSIGYEHGLDEPWADLKDAAMTAAADRVNRERSTISPRTRSMTNDLGVTQQFSYAGKDHPTGLDEVDAVIMKRAAEYQASRVGIA